MQFIEPSSRSNYSSKTSLSIRPTDIADIDALMKIQRHREVVPFQFPRQSRVTKETWIANLECVPTDTRHKTGLLSVVYDKQIVGYISYASYRKDDREGPTFYDLGFNLHPDFWGRGIMTQSLIFFIDTEQTKSPEATFFADCFSYNERCKGLLRKLGFKPGRIPLDCRLYMAIGERCLRWVKRYRLN